jgi:hypothetical protein
VFFIALHVGIGLRWPSAFWRFQVTGDKISRIETGQARALT